MNCFIRLLILLVFFTVMVYWQITEYKEHQRISDKYLHNNIAFEGLVTNLKQSGNHNFGIIQLKLTKSNVTYFVDSVREGIYPYRIRGNMAEVFCTVSPDRKLNDTLKVISNDRMIYFNPQFSKELENIEIIIDANNRAFVRKNSIIAGPEVPLFPQSPLLRQKDVLLKEIVQ